MMTVNPITPSLLSRLPGPPGGLDSEAPDAKNQGYYQLIEMKLCLSHYSHKRMSDAKSESGSFSRFGDITSQNFSLKKVTSH